PADERRAAASLRRRRRPPGRPGRPAPAPRGARARELGQGDPRASPAARRSGPPGEQRIDLHRLGDRRSGPRCCRRILPLLRLKKRPGKGGAPATPSLAPAPAPAAAPAPSPAPTATP